MDDGNTNEKQRLSIPWVLWGLWKHKNTYVFEGKQGDINILISDALDETELFLHQQEQVRLELKLSQQAYIPLDRIWCRTVIIGSLKRNMYASWNNSNTMCGDAWIIRDHRGEAVFHARETFTPVTSCMAAELRCMLWVIKSLHDLHSLECEIWSESTTSVDAVSNKSKWPMFRTYLDQIHHLLTEIQSFKFCVSSYQANSIAREIAKSVTRDGRFRSYLSIGGPAWLHDRLFNKRQLSVA